MGIRIRAILVIVVTNLFIILFSIGVGIRFVERNLDISLKADLNVISNMADHYLSNELDILKLKANQTVIRLETAGKNAWSQVLAEQGVLFPEFVGMAVFDSAGQQIAAAGETPAQTDILDDGEYIKRAFHGEKIISSTTPQDGIMMFYLAVPAPDGMILVATLPGMYFSERLAPFVIWETGHIFMSDADGYAIANPREYWVRERFNYIRAAETDKAFAELAATVTRMTRGESGIGYYSVGGVPRICSYRPVSASVAGWSFGTVAPLTESPVRNTDKGLILVGLISIILNVVAAIIASNFIKKPFDKIEALKKEADAANQAKSSFLSTMSHEIRTPMNAILGITEIQLQHGTLDPVVREALERVHNSGDLLLSIINDILDLSKIEAGKLELIKDTYEIASLVSDTAQLNMMRIGSKLIEFELRIDENMPSNMYGDELRVKQILNNLLSNAFKYTATGKVTFSVTSESSKRNDDEVILIVSVSDTGQGMSKEQISKLFDEYSQFNQKANRTTEGTGLGMGITRNLVRLMGGEIFVQSEPGKGSVFTVQLPQGKTGSNALGAEVVENLHEFRTSSRSQMKRVQISREPMPYGKIMIVDDVETNIYVAKGLMIPYELQIDSALSGQSVIEKIKNGNVYDIIFMDHMMPGMDGVEATKRLRAMGYDHPIVALTANAVSGQSDVFLSNGFDDFIPKPIDIRQLNVVLNKLIRDKQPPEVLEEVRRQVEERKTVQDSGAQQLPANRHFIKVFAQDTGKSIAALEALIEKGTYGEEDIRTYIIHTHGMKSALAYAGKMELSATALKLEQLARDNNIEAITAETPAFLDELRALAEEFSPKDKNGGGAAVPAGTRLSGSEIAGLNIAEGLERYGGDEDTYIMVLRSYAASVRSMLGAIEKVNENGLPEYEVKVHGIKGVSREVFAPQIAEAAYALEKAAAAGDYGYVGKHNPEFLEAAWKLINDLDALLAAMDTGKTKPEKDKPDADVLANLLEACKVYDIDAADAAMAEIEKYQYISDGGLVDFLQSSFAVMEFDSIVEKLSNKGA